MSLSHPKGIVLTVECLGTHSGNETFLGTTTHRSVDATPTPLSTTKQNETAMTVMTTLKGKRQNNKAPYFGRGLQNVLKAIFTYYGSGIIDLKIILKLF